MAENRDDPGLPLQGMRVGISGAIPEPELWGGRPLDQEIIEFVAQFAGLVFKYGGQIVHGSNPTLTPIIVRQSERLRRNTGDVPPLILVSSDLYGKRNVAAKYTGKARMIRTPRMGRGNEKNEETRNQSLTAMRLTLVQEMLVNVAIGGKLHLGTKRIPGVMEELAMARWRSIPSFVVGGFGGYASELDRSVVAELCEPSLLSDATRDEIATSDDIRTTVGTIVGHLVKWRHDFAEPRDWPNVPVVASQSGRIAKVNDELLDVTARRVREVTSALEKKELGLLNELLVAPPVSTPETATSSA